ncbi:TCP-1/cpn60 chaperonin family protein [Candidatus Woesearchaeota archaeon]|nr:TCP-1/cpn60 chaperonin family protein [Candidatus Woesearchaeota archaeon]
MTNQPQVQPIFIMPEGTQRSQGRTAQRNNIMAAKLVAETVRTTLGPKGMDKMLVDSLGDVVITNDGVTILEEMSIEHPSAKMIVEIAKTQEDEVGDGTTTAVVIAGELLKKAEGLLDQEVHPTVIAKGYRMASEKSMEILDKMAEKITSKDEKILKMIAVTAMTGKGAEAAKEALADLAVKAVIQVMDEENGTRIIDLDNIKIEKKVGASYSRSEFITGIVVDKERVHSGMPKTVKKAKIVLVDSPIEIKNTEIDAKIQITDPSQLQAFLDSEEKMLRDMVEQIAASGANVLFCQKGIDDVAQHFLARKGIFAARRLKKSDMEKLARATGAKIITKLKELSASDLGYAGVVEEVKVGDEDMTYVKECKSAKAVTLLIRGGTEHVADEIKRAMEDAVGDVATAIRSGKVVPGAGAPEIELSKCLMKYAESLSGREQLAVKAFAEAVEIIPRTLAENGGLDPIDVLTELKAAHDKNLKAAGINVFTGKVMDSWKHGVIEPLQIKTQAIGSASEVAVMILRIDDVIAKGGDSRGAPQGMPPGMPPGGMGDY